MKKLWFLLSLLTLSFGLSACSEGNSEEMKEQKKTTEAAADTTNDAKRAMVKFYMALSKTINDKDADLNAYELSEEEPTAEIKTNASESAAAVAEEVKNVQVPEELKDQKVDLEAVLRM